MIQRDIADLVRACQEEQASLSTGGRTKKPNLIDTILHEQLDAFTSVGFDGSTPGPEAARITEQQAVHRPTGGFIDPRAWSQETDWPVRHTGAQPLTKPPRDTRADVPTRNTAGMATPDTPARPTVRTANQPGTGSLPTMSKQGTGSLPTAKQGSGSLPTMSKQGTGSLPRQSAGSLPRQSTGSLPRQNTGSLSTAKQGTGPSATIPAPIPSPEMAIPSAAPAQGLVQVLVDRMAKPGKGLLIGVMLAALAAGALLAWALVGR